MELSSRLDPVLSVARESARDVDATARYPCEAVDALRASGLLGLTLPAEIGGLGGGPRGWFKWSAPSRVPAARRR